MALARLPAMTARRSTHGPAPPLPAETGVAWERARRVGCPRARVRAARPGGGIRPPVGDPDGFLAKREVVG